MSVAPSLMFILLCFYLAVVSAITNITTTKFLRDSETFLSSNAVFKIGFFSPANSRYRYVGIWYNIEDSDAVEVVWVANRNNPINDSSGVLKISEDGNLQLLDGQNTVMWSPNISLQGNSPVAQLLDTGNLVLLSSDSGMTVWQSFDHLTNSLLPQARILIDKGAIFESSILQSWKSASDPSNGQFRIGIIPRTLLEFVTWDGDKLFWRSGPWNGNLFLGVPRLSTIASMGFRIINNNHEGKLEVLFSVEHESLLKYFVLNYDGNVIAKNWDDGSQKWEIGWQSFESECAFYGKCGPFGTCNPRGSPICRCLKGFEPKVIDEWQESNWTSGCVRRTPLQCGNNTGGKVDDFLRLKNMNVPDYADLLLADDQDDCKRKCLGNCSCLAYAYPKGIGCMMWNGSLIDLQQLYADGADLFIRLAHSELDETGKWKLIISVIAIMVTVAFAVFGYYLWRFWMHRISGKKSSDKETHFAGTGVDPSEFKDLELFEFNQLEVATRNFSVSNKLGQGGFGVYKGKLENGQEIAVKRLSRASGQGLQEFMNEVLVISKFQHNNLVRLLGCCVEGEEKMLVYEYMPNGSLDALLFDPNHREQLDWMKRFNIINGICRGLLYLHRDSRLKIIHRDLKASNILIDEELDPKISDFGMARIFGMKQDQANTLRVVGTYGYMSPEYAMEGRFSEKSDVFSLGVLLLEIVSGRKNNSFLENESLSLLTYAWKLWNEDSVLSLIDPTIFTPSFQVDIVKCIQLGLLCVQEYPEDRPTISALISMLEVDDITELPHPKQPGFTQRQVSSTDKSSQLGHEHCTVNRLTLTVVSGR